MHRQGGLDDGAPERLQHVMGDEGTEVVGFGGLVVLLLLLLLLLLVVVVVVILCLFCSSDQKKGGGSVAARHIHAHIHAHRRTHQSRQIVGHALAVHVGEEGEQAPPQLAACAPGGGGVLMPTTI